MVESLNLSGNLSSYISRLKGDPVVAAISSTSFSFIVTIAQQSSSIRISPCPLGETLGCLLCVVNCWDRSWSRLLFSLSLKFSYWPNLLKMLPELLLSPFWLRHALMVRLLALMKAGVWECTTSALGLAPVCCVLTTIRFSPIRCVHSALEFLSVCYPPGTFKFSPIYYEGGVCCPLVALFLLVLTKL